MNSNEYAKKHNIDTGKPDQEFEKFEYEARIKELEKQVEELNELNQKQTKEIEELNDRLSDIAEFGLL